MKMLSARFGQPLSVHRCSQVALPVSDSSAPTLTTWSWRPRSPSNPDESNEVLQAQILALRVSSMPFAKNAPDDPRVYAKQKRSIA